MTAPFSSCKHGRCAVAQLWLRMVGFALPAVCAATLTIGCQTADSRECTSQPLDYQLTPVILIHGLGQDASLFEDMICFLERGGYPRTYLNAIDLEPSDGPNAAAAERQIGPFVEQALIRANAILRAKQPSAHPFNRVDLVAHSMGALSARWYAAQVRPERVRVLLTTAGAHHGTTWGCPGRAGSGHAEMCSRPTTVSNRPESSLQNVLNGLAGGSLDETPFGIGPDRAGVFRIPADTERSIRYLSLRLPRDEYIIPVESSVLAGAGPLGFEPPPEARARETSSGNLLLNLSEGHDDLVRSPAVLELVRRALHSADTRAEPD